MRFRKWEGGFCVLRVRLLRKAEAMKKTDIENGAGRNKKEKGTKTDKTLLCQARSLALKLGTLRRRGVA